MVFGLLKSMDWEDIKSPVLFVSGMLVGVVLVILIWYLLQVRQLKILKKQREEEEENNADDPDDPGQNPNYPSAIIVADARGDYLLEDKSQLGQVIDFKKVPRNEAARQAARRDLVITMLIAESMSK